jgi:mono/diheme cytochrome c family protein
MFERFSFPKSLLRLLALFSLLAASIFLISSGVMPARAQSKNSPRPSEASGAAADVARGKYLVEGVAICGQCHTPRDNEGNGDRNQWLQGGPVPYQPSTPVADWPQTEPRIGGTLPAPDVDMVKLLTTGIWTNGTRLRAPMPQFRMTVSDAQAVVAYLKTVKAQQ